MKIDLFKIILSLDLNGYSYHLTSRNGMGIYVYIFQKERICKIAWANNGKTHISLFRQHDKILDEDISMYNVANNADHSIHGLMKYLHESKLKYTLLGERTITVLVDFEDRVILARYSENGLNDFRCLFREDRTIGDEESLFSTLEELPAKYEDGTKNRLFFEQRNDDRGSMKDRAPFVPVRNIYELLRLLGQHGIWYEIGHYGVDTLTVRLANYGERIEIDYGGDGQMSVARFRGEEISDQSVEELLMELFASS